MHDILYMYKFLQDIIFANLICEFVEVCKINFVKILTISQGNMHVEGGP